MNWENEQMSFNPHGLNQPNFDPLNDFGPQYNTFLSHDEPYPINTNQYINPVQPERVSPERTIYVGNLDPRMNTKERVNEMFEEFGNIEKMVYKGGFCFITYRGFLSAQKAIQTYNNSLQTDGRRLSVCFAGENKTSKKKVRKHSHKELRTQQSNQLKNVDDKPLIGNESRKENENENESEKKKESICVNTTKSYENQLRTERPLCSLMFIAIGPSAKKYAENIQEYASLMIPDLKSDIVMIERRFAIPTLVLWEKSNLVDYVVIVGKLNILFDTAALNVLHGNCDDTAKGYPEMDYHQVVLEVKGLELQRNNSVNGNTVGLENLGMASTPNGVVVPMVFGTEQTQFAHQQLISPQTQQFQLQQFQQSQPFQQLILTQPFQQPLPLQSQPFQQLILSQPQLQSLSQPQSQSQLQLQPQSQILQSQSQSQSQSQLQPQPQSQQLLQSQLQSQPQSQSQPQPQPQLQPQPQPQLQSQSQSQPQLQSQSQPQLQSQSQPQLQSQSQPQLQPQSQPQLQPQSQPQLQSQSQLQSQTQPFQQPFQFQSLQPFQFQPFPQPLQFQQSPQPTVIPQQILMAIPNPMVSYPQQLTSFQSPYNMYYQIPSQLSYPNSVQTPITNSDQNKSQSANKSEPKQPT